MTAADVLAPATTISIPVIETERLILRAHRLEDIEAEAAFYRTERSRMVGGPMERDQVWRGVAARIGHWALRGYGYWALEDKATGAYCGRVGLWFPDGFPEPEIGWLLMEGAEGKGLAFEAATAARRHAYGTLGWSTAISLIRGDNTRSLALARRLGARFERIYEHPRFGAVEIHRHPGPEELT